MPVSFCWKRFRPQETFLHKQNGGCVQSYQAAGYEIHLEAGSWGTQARPQA